MVFSENRNHNDLAIIFRSIIAVLNENYFDCEPLFEHLGMERDLADSLVSIATYSWDSNDIKELVESLVRHDPEITDQTIETIDYETIKTLLDALEGDL